MDIYSLFIISVCSMKIDVNDNDFFVDLINSFIDDNIQLQYTIKYDDN